MERQKKEIPSFELMYDDQPADFVIKKVQEGVNNASYREDLPHRHNYYTVLWPQDMDGRHIIDYKDYTIKANDLFFVNPEQIHQVLLGEKRTGILLMFTCGFLDRYFISKDFITNLGLFSEISENPPISVDDKSAKALKIYASEIINAFNQQEIYRFEKIGAYLKLFLIECNRFAPGEKNRDNPQNVQSAKPILRKFKEILELNFKTLRQVNDYSDLLNISPDYLNSVIKSGVGKTAKELIQQRIVLESKRLGLHTELSTKEIAYSLGFEDPSHFSRFFKNNEGMSFADFRGSLEKSMNGS